MRRTSEAESRRRRKTITVLHLVADVRRVSGLVQQRRGQKQITNVYIQCGVALRHVVRTFLKLEEEKANDNDKTNTRFRSTEKLTRKQAIRIMENPDNSDKGFWSGAGKSSVLHPHKQDATKLDKKR